MNSMKNILILIKFENGKSEFSRFLPWLLLSVEETCQPWLKADYFIVEAVLYFGASFPIH